MHSSSSKSAAAAASVPSTPSSSPHITVAPCPRDGTRKPTPDHWVGNPPTRFKNPWPSFRAQHSMLDALHVRFGSERKFVPVPKDRKGLVAIKTPDWGAGKRGIKATWIGHSTFLIEAPASANPARGVRLFFDPVFCDRMGPYSAVGPKRFSPPPCRLEDVPQVDAVCISHNHYDHLDAAAIRSLYFDKRRTIPLHLFCGLGTGKWLVSCGIQEQHITEMDWWDEVDVAVSEIGSVKLVCTPSQHTSRRGAWDECQMLWCSFVVRTPGGADLAPQAIYFAGDTGYRSVTEDDVAAGKDEAGLPRCPAFAEIGEKYGPFDLALLPIGCYTPRTFMSAVHSSPEDSIEIHVDIRSKKSVGMHYGTVRGGLSAQYEDVLEPPARWKAACESRGLEWGDDVLLCAIGETVVADS